MRRWILALGLMVPLAAHAAVPTQTQTAPQTPIAPSQMSLGVVTATSLTYPAGTTTAVCTVEGQAVRYRDDGTAPTATVGTLIAIGSVVTIRLTNMTSTSNAQFIQTGATALLDCMFYK